MEIKTAEAKDLIAYLRSPTAIRERCGQVFTWVNAGQSPHFSCDLTQLGKVADYVIEVMRCEYPNLQIPFHSRWRHFEAKGVPRLAQLNTQLAELTPLEKAAAKFDLAIISVLLDAGAGDSWRYYEQETKLILGRSEGLAVASFQMFCQGTFSSNSLPQADAFRLQTLTEIELAKGLQVNTENPLVGIFGRCKLLQKLGQVLISSPHLFGDKNPRPGNLVNYLWEKSQNQQLAAATVLSLILEGLSDIWPGRLEVDGVNLGDVWQHPAVADDGFVPFHKLSQWLTYSLLEPLQELGLEITGLDTLTGLPEYRNGGLCLDLGLISAKYPEIFNSSYSVASEVIVEWRALTVILLDQIAVTVREKLGMSAEELPLVKILQGGTWTAGRKIAAELRTSGEPPIQIASDGTVF
ncbi:URC4/urg3 family protein [Nostocaceae cyanobacterium CENA357]|uniref:URC4/urg3 family protein n=1 Tax=Atlanticothrix silvestris CENA357 TaxID=1725252 RepID=A0A8J7HDP7_9CYAN|nr:URC4/urg3 family protein [Atlanticothrix silvestris]MBH8551134.1 URC4/urg3 family protein [Atlanticothrix silvestris CENA357]